VSTRPGQLWQLHRAIASRAYLKFVDRYRLAQDMGSKFVTSNGDDLVPGSKLQPFEAGRESETG
jgi:hypothetical protein